MKIQALCLVFIFTLTVTSCRKKLPNQKVIYEDSKSVDKPDVDKDTTAIRIADLPILIEGTEVLIHPIGDLRLSETYSRSYGSSGTNQVSYSLSSFNRFKLTGQFQNLKFQHIDSTSLKPLFNKEVQISSATYLAELASKTDIKKMVYTLVDADTNRDAVLDQNDINSLYISNADGTALFKLSKEYQELIDWSYIANPQRLYFKSLEDINTNGTFDKEDKLHYYFLNLLNEDAQPEEYFPTD